jgi:hypothetical protein
MLSANGRLSRIPGGASAISTGEAAPATFAYGVAVIAGLGDWLGTAANGATRPEPAPTSYHARTTPTSTMITATAMPNATGGIAGCTVLDTPLAESTVGCSWPGSRPSWSIICRPMLAEAGGRSAKRHGIVPEPPGRINPPRRSLRLQLRS